ncbi:MAG TPA: HlyD family secretion protein [Pyrinomonadaceae bacterium]
MSTTIDDEAQVEDERKEPVLIDEHGEPLQPAPVDRETRKRPLYRRPAFLIAAVILLLIGAAIGINYWLYARSHETTDDAFIDAHVTPVSPKVSGYVAKVHVQANQQVKKGDLLIEIDPRDYQTRLDQAKAALAAGEARLTEARTGVELTRASSRANVQQASGTVQQARAGVEASRAQAAAERTRVTQAGAAISAAQANLQQAQAQVDAAQAELVRAQADVARYQELYSKDEVSRQRLDQAIATARTAEAQTEAARQRAAAAAAQVSETRAAQGTAAETARRAEVQIGGAQAQVREAQGRLAGANTAPQQIASSEAQAQTASASLEQLRAAVAQAELELSYTKLYAPDNGRVTNKSVEEGALVQSGQPLMAIVPGDVWVTANFKENQIGNLRPGQPVDITVDAYSDKTFKGHVDSIQAGTGARFSLLPPENATGNYVKVVQRVPVKIVFDEAPDPQHMLAPGMSVEPEVKVR